jgi:predicted nucleic acid-binding protein
MILDSTFLIDLLKGDSAAVSFAKQLEQTIPRTTVINEFKLRKGIQNNKGIAEFLDNLDILPISRKIAQKAASISYDLRKKGLIIGSEDCFIAAAALLEEEPLVTRNAKHFQRIPQLKVISY